MGRYLIAYDLGTGGAKSSLYNYEGVCIAETFFAYDTYYPRVGWHEQRPQDWWTAIVNTTQALLNQMAIDSHEITALGISGHSLGVVPLDSKGQLLRDSTPIWSDARSVAQTRQMFSSISEKDWYLLTGNGFPAAHYSAFKIMWYRDHEPEIFNKIDKVIGTKDYINFRMTGRIVTDYSYASGSGVYDLVNWQYSQSLIQACGLATELFAEIVPSTEVIGTLTKKAALELGLPEGIQVVAGGVDNSCMAVGARNTQDGRIYSNQGSSSGIAVTSAAPILDELLRPFVFTAVIPGLFNSAVPVFSAGTSFRWVRDQFCQDLIEKAKCDNKDVYDLMTAMAATSPVGARGVIFNPSFAGGSSVDASMNIRGAFIGLDLGHSRSDLIRSAMEGIALELGMAVNELRKKVSLGDEMVVVGGGSRSPLWRQIYADVYKMRIIKTNIDQQAAALGAAALAAVGTGIWKDFHRIDEIHKVEDVTVPVTAHVAIYDKIMPIFIKAGVFLAEVGELADHSVSSLP